jgi:Glycosyl transferases group 1
MSRALLVLGLSDPAYLPLLDALAARGFVPFLAPASVVGEARAAGVPAESAFDLLDADAMARIAAARGAFAARVAALEPAFWRRFTVGDLSLWERMRAGFLGTLDDAAGKTAAVAAVLEALAARGDLAGVVLGYDMVPPGRAAVAVARRLGLPTVHVPHAVFPRPRVEMSFQGSRSYADVVCAPGEFSRARYLAAGAAPAGVMVTGAPRWDGYAAIDDAARVRMRAAAAAGLGLDAGAPIVLFGPSWIERSTANAAQHVAGGLAVYRGVLAAVRAHPGTQLVVKLHPGELSRPGLRTEALLTGWHGVAARAGADRVVVTGAFREELVASADVVVSVNSNLGLEALLCGRPLVNVPLIPEEADTLFAPGEEGVVALRHPDETAPALSALIADAGRRARLAAAGRRRVERWVHAPDGRAFERVAEVVARVVAPVREGAQRAGGTA